MQHNKLQLVEIIYKLVFNYVFIPLFLNNNLLNCYYYHCHYYYLIVLIAPQSDVIQITLMFYTHTQLIFIH